MHDPNTDALKIREHNRARYTAAIQAGMIPVARASTWPAIVFRWGMKHEIGPMPLVDLIGGRELGLRPVQWADGIWVEAWVYILFYVNRSLDVFSNAWTSIQENKPKILELKMAYDEAMCSPERQVTILTSFLLSEDRQSDDTIKAASAGLSQAQNKLKNKEQT